MSDAENLSDRPDCYSTTLASAAALSSQSSRRTSACVANPGACAVVGAAAGTWILWKNAPKMFCTAGHCQTQKMLTDPEKEEYITDEEPVMADTLQEAQRKCRQLASARGLQLQGIKEPSRRVGKRYVCKFGGYVEK